MDMVVVPPDCLKQEVVAALGPPLPALSPPLPALSPPTFYLWLHNIRVQKLSI